MSPPGRMSWRGDVFFMTHIFSGFYWIHKDSTYWIIDCLGNILYYCEFRMNVFYYIIYKHYKQFSLVSQVSLNPEHNMLLQLINLKTIDVHTCTSF